MAHPYTQESIRKVFIELLDEKPITKISVKEISEKCEISRNTFYYYYPDIYAILKEVFSIELEKVIGNYNNTLSWEDSFIQATSFAIQHKKCIYHIYHSMQKEELEGFLYNIAGDVMKKFIESKNKDIGASNTTCDVITKFYQGALTQMTLQWVSNDCETDPTDLIHYIGTLFNGNIEASLKRGLTIPPLKTKTR